MADIRGKIEKLLALSKSSNEHEAKSALLKAKELMATNKMASEMCLTMYDELMAEVDKMSKEIKEQNKSKVIEILKEQDK